MKKALLWMWVSVFTVSVAHAQTFPVNNLTVAGTSAFSGQAVFTLSPTGPTPAAADSSTKLATTQFLTGPGPLGNITPNTGAFTSLSANVSNPGFTYLSPGSGAVARNYAGKFGDTVSITDFGADSSGVADSTSAIQSAITYILSLPTGGSVYMPRGVYKVTSQINIPNTTSVSFTLYGEGSGTKLRYSGSSTVNLFSAGSGTATFGSLYVFADFGVTSPTGGSVTAIALNNINSSLIYNVSVFGNTNALTLNSSYNTRIIGCDFNGQSQYGVTTLVTGTNSLIIENSVISSAGTAAINLAVGGNNIVIRDNDLEANVVTLALANYTSVLFEGNYAENATNSYFSFSGTNNAVDIRQNWLGANTTTTGINNVTGGSFVNNTLYNSAFTYSNTFDFDSGGNVITGTATLAATPYQTSISLINNWTTGPHTPGYKKSSTGIVELRGSITAGSGSGGNTAFVLPSKYWPAQQKVFTVYNGTTGTAIACIVDVNGNVVPVSGASGNVVNLDGIMFNAAN
jgi:hypothetical protein